MKSTARSWVYTPLVLAFLLTLALSPAAVAQQGGFEIGGDAGVMEFDDELGGEQEFRGAFRAGYFFTDRFELEGQALRATSIFDLELSAYLINGVYHFRSADAEVVPYVLAGVGTADVDISTFFLGPTISDSGRALQAAFGVRFYVGDSHQGSWRLEVSALNEDTFDEDSTHLSLVGGFSWRFGS